MQAARVDRPSPAAELPADAPLTRAAAMPTLHALLLTDIVDSTQLAEQLGDAATAALWALHDRVARDLLPPWRGREIDKTDGMLLLFDDVSDAVGYALAYHHALAARELPFKARAGIHVGPVSLRSNPADDVARGAKPVEVHGIALPIAARVMSVALGAQTLLSADARLALGVPTQRVGPRDRPLRVVSHGHWRLHGVADPMELFEVGEVDRDGAPFTAPPDGAKVYRVVRQGDLWQPVREVRHSVPAERDSFVGRQQPLQWLAKKFEDGARLVSVLGMGGTGKTRLVTRFAWSWLGDYPGGVWFCDLSQARTLDGIHFAVAQGLDVPLGKTDPVVQLAHAIAGRGRCLVILDNFEQVARFAEATLGRWLDRAPLARFLVTTREVLGIVGEETLALEPLPADDAAALFLRRAEAARQGYAPSADDVIAVRQLVKVLDGLPLAIELAAARVRIMAPRTLLARMHERFDVLRSRAGRHDRQATLRAAFDWSWELLSEPERAALAQLSVFEGGFTLESAEGVLDLSCVGADPPAAADVTQWLIDKSFVRQLAGDRFDLLESVREYAAEHLRTEGRFAGSGPGMPILAEQRHGAFFASMEADRSNPLTSRADLDNIAAACRRATDRSDAKIASKALRAAWRRTWQYGPFRYWANVAQAVRAIPGIDGEALLEAELTRGLALFFCGPIDEAMRQLSAARSTAQALGNRNAEARALHALASLQVQSGAVDAAERSFEKGLQVAEGLGDVALECAVFNAFGTFCDSVGRFAEARSYYERALQMAQAAGERRWEGGSAGNLAQFLNGQGKSAEARPLFAQAIAIAREMGDRQWEANARCNLGLLHFAEGRPGEARTELEATLATALELGHVRLSSIVQCNLGLVAEALGQPAAARTYHESALVIARDLGDRRSEGQFLTYLGLLHARQERTAQGRTCLDLGETLLRAASDRVSLGILLCARAETEHRAGNTAAGELALAQASALADELSDVDPNSEFGQALGRTRQLFRAVA
jgi:predicted ATPase/Tfp pilus assembly protein PilF